MQLFAASSPTAAQRRLLFRCVDATDQITPKTGLTFAAGELRLSKNGAAPANHTGTITEIGNGLYYYEAAVGELDTPGFFSLFVVKTAVFQSAFVAQVLSATSDLAGVIADGVMVRPTSSYEVAAPVKSLGTAVQKATHRTRDNAGTLEIYRSDGATVHARQAITTDTTNQPIDELGGAA
jgi:hypothetical protein